MTSSQIMIWRYLLTIYRYLNVGPSDCMQHPRNPILILKLQGSHTFQAFKSFIWQHKKTQYTNCGVAWNGILLFWMWLARGGTDINPLLTSKRPCCVDEILLKLSLAIPEKVMTLGYCNRLLSNVLLLNLQRIISNFCTSSWFLPFCILLSCYSLQIQISSTVSSWFHWKSSKINICLRTAQHQTADNVSSKLMKMCKHLTRERCRLPGVEMTKKELKVWSVG